MTELAVEYRQDPETSWWTVTVPDEPAVVSQGRTLREAYDRVRQALPLVRKDANALSLRGRTVWEDRGDLSPDVLEAVRLESDLRLRSMEIEEALERATRVAVEVLIVDSKLTYRSAGSLLGITHQRVEQILKGISSSSSTVGTRTHSR